MNAQTPTGIKDANGKPPDINHASGSEELGHRGGPQAKSFLTQSTDHHAKEPGLDTPTPPLIDRKAFLDPMVEIMNADYRDLVSVARDSCRYCHGEKHSSQWRTQREFKEAHFRWMSEPYKLRRVKREPTAKGGFGYKATRAPNPCCTRCHGEGIARVIYRASQDANGRSHPLFDGAYQTKHGINVKTRDRMKYVDIIAKAIGMFHRPNGGARRKKAKAGRRYYATGEHAKKYSVGQLANGHARKAEPNATIVPLLTRQEYLKALLEIVYADPGDLVSVVVDSCRYCHGENHAYQWQTHGEFTDAHLQWMSQPYKLRRVTIEPIAEGGFAYNATRSPNPRCPECDGRGEARVLHKASQHESVESHPLFGGMRVTKNGVTFRLRNRLKVWNVIGKMMGFFEPPQGGAEESDDPATKAIRKISAKGSMAPINGFYADGTPFKRPKVQDPLPP